MDNVTHSLVGLAIAEGVFRFREFRQEKISRGWKPLALFLSFAANNFPDLDFLYASFLGGKLGYLLHHRGHTHTLLFAIPQGLLVFFFGLWISRKKKWEWSLSEKNWLLLICLIGAGTHIGLDALNSYGVHPFWPFHSRWFYGDSVFIVEPLFWVCLVPPLAFAVQGTVWRALIASFFVLGIGLCWFTPFVPASLALVVTAVGGISVVVTWKLNPSKRILATAGLAVIILLVFLSVSGYSREVFVKKIGATKRQDAVVLKLDDVILSPMPANLFCWAVITVETNADEGIYRLRRGIFAPFPEWFSPEQCPLMRMKVSTLPLQPVKEEKNPHLNWLGEWTGNLSELQLLWKSHCQAKGLLKFARAPFWIPLTDQQFVMGDFRYDTDKELSFSELIFSKKTIECPPAVPGWEEPRRGVLEEVSSTPNEAIIRDERTMPVVP